MAAVDRDRLRRLLESVRKGDTAPDDALERIARLPFVDTEHARVDTHRAIRHGIPEVVLAAGKRPEQVVSIVRALRAVEQDAIVTRVEEAAATAVLRELDEGRYHSEARVLWFGPETPREQGKGTRIDDERG